MADHAGAQQRLVQAALKVFASKGYEGASTREICRLAEVNVAAIHYYFGDKASLYRAIFRLPEVVGRLPAEIDDPELPPRVVLAAFYRHILSYIGAPEQVRQMRLLFLREELHPTGVLDDHTDATLRVHEQLARYLARVVGVHEIDAALQQLGFSIVGIALVLFVHRSAIDQAAPELLADDTALSATIDRLTDHGVALIEGEIARRSATTAIRRATAHANIELSPQNVARRSRRGERS